MTEASNTSLAGRELVGKISAELVDRKAEDIAVYDVHDLPTVADHYIICSGTTPVHGRAIAESTITALKKHHTYPTYREGVSDGRWAVLDYTDVVVHIMTPEMRDYYEIEKLWKAGTRLTEADIPVLAEGVFSDLQ